MFNGVGLWPQLRLDRGMIDSKFTLSFQDSVWTESLSSLLSGGLGTPLLLSSKGHVRAHWAVQNTSARFPSSRDTIERERERERWNQEREEEKSERLCVIKIQTRHPITLAVCYWSEDGY